jgi:endogenous inhibitor of DNA gyrase (YacG/DUF329 family)
MSFDLLANDPCPKCRKPITISDIESHPTRNDVALHNFACAECGAVRTKIVSLKERAA